MKRIGILTFSLILMLACTKKDPATFQGQIVFLSGSAIAVDENGSAEKQLQIGDIIAEKTSIKTAENSYCEIEFPGLGLIRLEPMTGFKVNNFKNAEYGFFELTNGALAAKIEKMSGSDKVLFKTETAVAAIRGTELLIDTNGTSAVIAVNEGTVALYPPDAAVSLEQSPIKAQPASQIREALPQLSGGQQAIVSDQAFANFKGKIENGKWPEDTLSNLNQIKTDSKLFEQKELNADNASRMIFSERVKPGQKNGNNADSGNGLIIGPAFPASAADPWFVNNGGKSWMVTEEDPGLGSFDPQTVNGYAYEGGETKLTREDGVFVLNLLKKGATFYTTGYNLDKAAPALFADRIYELALTLKASQQMDVIVKVGENNRDYNGDGEKFSPYLKDQPVTLTSDYKTYRFRFTTNYNNDPAPNFVIFTGHLDVGQVSLKGYKFTDIGPAPAGLPFNGNFDYGLLNWSSWAEASTQSAGRIFFTGNAIGIECTVPSNQTWHYQTFPQLPFSLTKGKTYTVSFDAWGNAKNMDFAVCENGIDFNKDGNRYSAIILSPIFSVDSIPRRYSFTQTVLMDYPSVRLHFYNGTTKNLLYLDNIEIIEK